MMASGIIGFIVGWAQMKTEILLVLTFHGITDKPLKPWEIEYSSLTSIINGLRRNDFSPLQPRSFDDWWAGKISGGRRFLVTFDDGLETSAQAIKRLYTEEKIASVLFVITDLLGKPGYVTKESLVDLRKSANCEIGLHGKRHEEATLIIDRGEDLAGELVTARKEIEAIIGEPIYMYAYPFGEFDQTATAAVASAGLKFGFTVQSFEINRSFDPHLLPRLMYLRGIEESGEPTVNDWMPPQTAKQGGFTLSLALLVFLMGVRIFYRGIMSFRK